MYTLLVVLVSTFLLPLVSKSVSLMLLSVKVALFALVSFEGDKGASDVLVEEAPRDKSVSLK